MPMIPYSRDIPEGPNNPSDDQPDMQQNTNSTDDIINVDHYSFGVNDGGYHKQLTLIQGALPGSRAVGMGTTYVKNVTRAAVVTAEEFYTPDATGNEYQVTQTIPASFANLFGANFNNYPSAVGATPTPSTNFTGGWVYLPGGLVLNYGNAINISASTGSVNFPVPYATACYTVNIQPVRNSTNVDVVYLVSQSTTGFTYRNTATGGGITQIYWTAIGK